MNYTIEVVADLTYEADPDELRERFPNEWREFMESSSDPSPAAWLRDCFQQNPDLFHLVDRTDQVESVLPKRVVVR